MSGRRLPTGEAGRRRAVTPGGKGRFGDFDVLGQVGHWDLTTAGVVLARLDTDVRLSFFSASEEPALRALVDVLLGQHDEPRVPVVEMMDRRLRAGETDGWRYADMPEDGDAWRQSLAALDDESRTLHDRPFAQLALADRASLVQDVQDADEWHGFVTEHLWSLWTRYACTAFYSHPWAWNEIGFGGPAYPRGYENMGIDRRERWERPETDAADPVRWVDRRQEAVRSHQERGQSADRGPSPRPATTLTGSDEAER